MALVALLYAHHISAGGDEPLAALTVTGIASVHRQIRQCRRAGASRVIVMVERMTPRLAASLERARNEDAGVEVVHGAAGVVSVISETDDVLSVDEGLVADERAYAAVVAAPGAAVIAVWTEGEARPIAAERIASDCFFAGIARFKGRLVREVAGRLGDWDMQATLLRAALGEATFTRVEVKSIPTYCESRRRVVPLQWARAVDVASAAAASGEALLASQKGVLDWPARFIHPRIENALTRLVLPTSLTPNMISFGAFLIGIVALVCFALGEMWPGLLLALAIGPLDGVDGKLARTSVDFSRWGDLEHVADKVVEYGWFAALAYHFHVSGHDGAWPIGVLIILFALAEAVQGEFFRRFTGMQIDDSGTFERRFRLIAGRRNTFFWALVPFGIADAWFAGFVMIAVYSAATFFVMQVSFCRRLCEYGSEHSARIAANFKASSYAFLPQVNQSDK